MKRPDLSFPIIFKLLHDTNVGNFVVLNLTLPLLCVVELDVDGIVVCARICLFIFSYRSPSLLSLFGGQTGVDVFHVLCFYHHLADTCFNTRERLLRDS